MARSIDVTLELDNKQYQRAIKQSKSQTQDFETSARSSFGAIATAFAALGGTAVIGSIANTGAAFQDLQNSLNVVFGSVDAGADAFDRVQQFASTTQFSVQTLKQAFVQLKGAGVEPTEELLQTFADTASVTTDQMGTFQAALDLVSRSTAGGLGLEDLNRLADRGIPVFRILQERLGLARLELSEFGKTAEGADRIISALLAGLQEDFGGALATQVGLINFELNQLGDAFDKLQNAIFQTFSDDAATAIQGLTAAINRLADNTEAIESLIKVFQGLVVVILSFGAVRAITGIMNSFQKALTRMFKVMGDGRTKTAGLAAAFRALFGQTKKSKFDEATKGLSGINKTVAEGSKKVFTITGGFATLARTLLRFTGIAGIAFTVFEGGKFILSLFEEEVKKLDKVVDDLTDELEDNTDTVTENTKAKELARIAEEAYERGLKSTTTAIKEQTEAFDKNDPLYEYQKFLAGIFEEAKNNVNGMDNLNRAIRNVQMMLDIDPNNVYLIEAMRLLKERLPKEEDVDPTIQLLKDLREEISQVDIYNEFTALQDKINELFRTGKIDLEEYNRLIRELNDAYTTADEGAQSMINAIEGISQGISDDLANAIVNGTDLMDSLKNTFKKVIAQMISDAFRLKIIEPILAGIFGGSFSGGAYTPGSGGFFGSLVSSIFGKAGGGSVMSNRPYVVGERGPELFVPGSSGTIVPNNAMGQQVTYNINAVDAPSFKALVARDPEFIFNVTQAGARRQPS